MSATLDPCNVGMKVRILVVAEVSMARLLVSLALLSHPSRVSKPIIDQSALAIGGIEVDEMTVRKICNMLEFRE